MLLDEICCGGLDYLYHFQLYELGYFLLNCTLPITGLLDGLGFFFGRVNVLYINSMSSRWMNSSSPTTGSIACSGTNSSSLVQTPSARLEASDGCLQSNDFLVRLARCFDPFQFLGLDLVCLVSCLARARGPKDKALNSASRLSQRTIELY